MMSERQTLPLGKVVTFQRGYDLPQRARKGGPVPIVSSAGVTDYHNTPMVDPPGVITGRYGTIGEIFLINEPYWPLNTTLYVRDFHGNDPCFVYYLLQRFDFRSFSGKSGVPGVNRNDLHIEPVTLPIDIEEQRAIAKALSDVDALIGSLDKLIAKKRDLKQAAMQQLLTGKQRLPDFMSGCGYKQTDVGAIPEDWDVRNVEDICIKVQDGTHFSPLLGGNDYLYVTSKNIGFGSLDVSTAERISATEHEIIYSRCDVKKDDLLLTKDGANTGNAALNNLDVPFSLLSSVAFLRFDHRHYIPAFFLQQILSKAGQKRIKDQMSGNAITRLTLQKIKSLRFPVTSVKEQTAIAAVLSDMDAEIAALEQRRDKTCALKQGMMQELLTGRVRLVNLEKAEAKV